jgi:hypothetical protein
MTMDPAPPAPQARTTLPVRCREPGGPACRFNLWGRCIHPRGCPDGCPLKAVAHGQLPRYRPPA